MACITRERFASFPVVRLSRTRTTLSRARSPSTRWEPRKPAPPVTRQTAMAISVLHLVSGPSAVLVLRHAPQQLYQGKDQDEGPMSFFLRSGVCALTSARAHAR